MRALRSIAVCGLLISAACSSTSRSHPTGAVKSGSASVGPAVPTGDEANVGSSTHGGTASAGPVRAGSPAPAAARGAGPARGSGAGASSGPAASTKPLVVGAYGLSAYGGAALATGASIGDPVKMSKGMEKWINAHGGVGGRQLQLVEVVTDITSSTPVDQQDQAACAKFTEDYHVAIVVSIVVTTPGFYDCLAKHGVFYISNTITGPDNAYYLAHDKILFSTTPTQDRLAATMADDLARQGYFKGAKVGIVYDGHPWWKSAAAAFKRQAATHDVNVDGEIVVCNGCSTQEQTSEVQNGIIKFRQANIDHVVLLSSTGTTFIQNAQASGYYPRLGMSSEQLPLVVSLNEPPQALNGAIGVGYMPATDVDTNDEPPLNAQMTLCNQIMADAGQPYPDRLVIEVARYTCDGYFFLKTLVDRTGGRTDLGLLRSAVDGVGATYVPAITWHAYYGPGRNDGVQTYRTFAYNLTCKCFKYITGEQQFTALPGQPR